MHRILIVDDDRISRDSLASLLRALGHEVQAAMSAEAARSLLQEFIPDIALLDIRLPGMFGDTFGVYLHRLQPNVKIIFISGELRLEHPERFGPEVEFLSKPLDFNLLLTTLAD